MKTPLVTMDSHRSYTVTTCPHVFEEDRWPIHSDDLPNLALDYKTPDGTAEKVYFRVRRTPWGMENQAWPLGFEEAVLDFAADVGDMMNLRLVAKTFAVGKANIARVKDMRFKLCNPNINTRNEMDAAFSIRILRAELETTRMIVWRHVPNPGLFLKDKQVPGPCGYFSLGDQKGYFALKCDIATLKGFTDDPQRIRITDQLELVEKFRKHILKCWPFAEQLGLTIALKSDGCANLYELNQWAAGLNSDVRKQDEQVVKHDRVIRFRPRVQEGLTGGF